MLHATHLCCLAPTIIHICHSGTGAFSGDHCGYLSLDASAIPGPGRSLKHPHGTFYCFVCFTPSSSIVVYPPLPPLALANCLAPPYALVLHSPHYAISLSKHPPPSVVGIMFIICSPCFKFLVSPKMFQAIKSLDVLPPPYSPCYQRSEIVQMIPRMFFLFHIQQW